METLWLCLENIAVKEKGVVVEIVGIFASEELAIKACLEPNFIIGPCTLNEALHDRDAEWVGAYYPLDPCEKHASE